MTLSEGSRLGPYEITGSLGAGGMGEVYKARDVRLDRTVALKVISTGLTDAPEVRARFEREARAISRLNHPHICTLHDVGRTGETDYLVLEYVQGETLSARVARGMLPPADAVAIGLQIADALATAHRHGIVHRDLKPGNVMLTSRRDSRGGSQVKLLDFGLAAIMAAAGSVPEPLTQTISAPLTGRGTMMGTLPYMAPEQLEGRPPDARSDVWAFGCLFYEMLTGRRPFDAPTEASLIGAILERQPAAVRELAPAVPRTLEGLVSACLTRDPEQRIESAQDLRIMLQWASAEGAGDSSTLSAPRVPSRRHALLYALGGLLAGFGVAALVYRGGLSTASQPVIRATIPLGSGSSFSPFGSNVAMSPDGALVVYAAADGQTSRLYLRAIDSLDVRPIAGTEGAQTPFFSPDGREIGFQAQGKLKRIGREGGTAVPIAEVAGARGAVWMPDDTIVYAPTFNAGLSRVNARGNSAPEPFTTLDGARHERTHRFPEMLPDGRTILYMVGDLEMTSYSEARIMARRLEGGEPTLIVRGALVPKYARSGHLLYHDGTTLGAVPFDPVKLEITGPRFAIAEHVAWSKGFGTAHYAVGGDGHVVYIPGDGAFARKSLLWMDRNGQRTVIHPQPSFFMGLRLSPDGSRLLLLEHAANDLLWTYDLKRQGLTRLTFRGSANLGVWTPGGTHVVGLVGQDIVRIPADGAGAAEILYHDETQKLFIDRSTDGRLIAFDSFRPATHSDIMLLTPDDRAVKPWQATRFNESQPRFSPDSRWIAYVSDETGRYEVFVRSVAAPSAKYQVSFEGGTSPVWSPMGGELFFVRPIGTTDTTLFSGDLYVSSPTDAGFTKPRLLIRGAWRIATFETPVGFPAYSYDVSSDGRRFVILESEPAPEPRQINLLWGALSRAPRAEEPTR